MSRKFDDKWWDEEKHKLEEKYGVSFSHDKEHRFVSREYVDYLKGQKLDQDNWYLRLCQSFRKFDKLNPDKETRIKIENATTLLDWDVAPYQCFSLALSMFLLTGIFALTLVLLLPIPLLFKLVVGSIPFLTLYYLLYYPHLKVLEKVLRSSEDLIFSVLYMIIYTHSSPNLEGAVLFTALNLKGPVSTDLKKVIWDVEVKKYSSLEESLASYVARWEPYNKDFLQAIQLVRASMLESSSERRINFLNAASNTILLGTRERMKHYSQELKMPITMLNGLGILLPVLGMIALPLMSIFLGGDVKLVYLVIAYDIVIPLFVYVFMANIMIKRPPTTTVKPIESFHMPPAGFIHFGKSGKEIRLPVWVLSILIFVSISGWSIFYYIVNGIQNSDPSLSTLIRSVLLIMGTAFSLAFYFYIGHRNRLKKQEEIKEIEQEFPVALFELGHRLVEGKPVEVALASSIKSMKNLKISDFFRVIYSNIRNSGMTFQESIFDKRIGALVKFPSKLIETVMKSVLEASRKGTAVASSTMITIATYLQNLHRTQEEIQDLMEETTTTMKFMGYILTPIIAGVAVSMTQIMGSALKLLADKFSEIEAISSGGVNTANLLDGLINFKEIIPPDLLQLVIGFYVIEILIIIGLFYSRVREGINKDYELVVVGRMLFWGVTIYIIASLVIAVLFGTIIQQIV